MSAYTQASDWYEPIGDILYRSTKPLIWRVGSLGTGAEYAVPVGTVFDVSIPRGLRWLFDPHDPRYLKAAALHDYFLALGWDRFTAGAQFHEALKADGVARWRRAVMTLAVLFFKYQ
ncbi:DUF1353 domain-containing protein [Sulfitobacter sp. M22]|uniref:DUF1353 domain-containing protein n=1 Tax=Sulfitobacter sp. M22 TaxID=2675332 RepID=UPI001F279EE6|nr:DUF1353 domain-containing protein [Sulfitobacter sp. M22]MCF7725791.1 DUF1353 domain-containing protein [Sulfitobacter sp. M22]